MKGNLSIETVRDPVALEQLLPDWWQLWRRCPSATPFQSPAWLAAWIREFARDRFLILCARRKGALVGLLPIDIDGEEARLCGGGITDYQDGVFEPELDPEVADRLLYELCDTEPGLRRVDLRKIPNGSVLLNVSVPPGWTKESDTGSDCRPVLGLPEPARALSETIPKRMIQQLRYYRRRAFKRGSVRVDRAQSDNAVEYFERLVALHSARWAACGMEGVLSDAAVLRFHHSAIPHLAQAGLLRIYVMKISEQYVGALYGFRWNDRFYYYIGGFDPEMRDLALGTLLVGHVIEEAVREGCLAFDFLSGHEAYKYRWGAVDEHVCTRGFERMQ